MSSTYTVSQLAAAVGSSPDTLRYYEKVGLLPEPPRTPSGYRQYDDGARDRLAFIRGAQRLGLTLADVRDLLAVRDTGDCPCEPAEELLSRRMAEIDIEISRLETLRAQMSAMLTGIAAGTCPAPDPETTWCACRKEVSDMAKEEHDCPCGPDCQCTPGCSCGCC
ncbi:MAG TPA: heavy metal-responsive transcriptional regulator [Nocardioides sp.]|jgi:DNA-binding transcriptional MerR regulator|nr:heavy metal-responsive transcriptional regulator [Nocardioides sp.]